MKWIPRDKGLLRLELWVMRRMFKVLEEQIDIEIVMEAGKKT